MAVPGNTNVFLNEKETFDPLLREDRIPAGMESLWETVKEHNKRLEKFAQARNMLGQKLTPEEKPKLNEQTESLADMLMCADSLVGFPVSKLELHESTYDYFDSLPARGEACGGKFRRIGEPLLRMHRFTWHIVQLLLVMATLLALHTGMDGRFSFLEIALLIATPVSFLFSDIWEKWPAKLLTHPVALILIGIYTVLMIVNSWSSTTPDYYFKTFMVYYGLVLVLMILDYIVQLGKKAGNRRHQKEFCRLYEKDREWLERYVRFHVLWWDSTRGSEPHPSRLRDLESELDWFARQYKRYK